MTNSIPGFDVAELETRFGPKTLSDQQAAAIDSVRRSCHTLAITLVEACPPSRELSDALTNLDYVAHQAGAAIERRWR